jgi:hypothetical protein
MFHYILFECRVFQTVCGCISGDARDSVLQPERLKHFVQMPCSLARRRSSLSMSDMGLISSSPGSHMTTLSTVVEQLKKERERVHKEVARIDAALARLSAAARSALSLAGC